jgi:hypothetical protein
VGVRAGLAGTKNAKKKKHFTRQTGAWHEALQKKFQGKKNSGELNSRLRNAAVQRAG